MSIRTRLSTLEARCESSLNVVIPLELDNRGKPFEGPPESRKVAGILFENASFELLVERTEGEDFQNFADRARAMALNALEGAVVLPQGAKWV